MYNLKRLGEQHSIVGLCAILCSLLPIPLVQAIALVCLVTYYIGTWACRALLLDESLVVRMVTGLSISTSLVLVFGLFAPLNGLLLRVLFALCALALLLISLRSPASRMRRKQATQFSTQTLLVTLCIVLPFALIAVTNQYILFLSDGWWHVSILNTIKHGVLPPASPWLPSATLAYPFAVHALLAFVFGATTIPGHVLFLIAAPFCTVLAALVVRETVVRYTSSRTGLFAAFALVFVSTIGSIAFVVDLLRKIPFGIPSYLEFLKAHQGPHMWYTAMKFINPAGVNTILQSTLMLAFFPLVFFVATVCLLLEKKYVLAAIAFLPLVSANPLYGMLAAFFVVAVLLYDLRWKGVVPVALVALAALAVNAAYILAIASKAAFFSGGGYAVSDANRASWMVLLFCIAYAPLLYLAVRELVQKRYDKRVRVLLVTLFLLHIPIAFGVYLGAVYMQTTAVLIIAILVAPYLSEVQWRFNAKNIFIGVLLLITVSSACILIATYSYYTITIDADRRQAAEWLQTNTPTNSVVLEDIGSLSGRALFVYSSTFGERQVYVADLPTLRTYAETADDAAIVYNNVFSKHDSATLCSLSDRGIQFVFAWSANEPRSPCLEPVFRTADSVVLAVHASDEAYVAR